MSTSSCLLCSASGAVIVPATTDLVSLIVALELVSLPTFALIALNRGDHRAGEAALKAFLFSVTSVAVSLYGIALLYGSTGSVAFSRLAIVATDSGPTSVAVMGLVMLLAVISFKISAVPFHAWAPDAYEGAPVPVAAFLSVVSKTAGFGALALVLATFAAWSKVWAPVIAVVAVLTWSSPTQWRCVNAALCGCWRGRRLLRPATFSSRSEPWWPGQWGRRAPGSRGRLPGDLCRDEPRRLRGGGDRVEGSPPGPHLTNSRGWPGSHPGWVCRSLSSWPASLACRQGSSGCSSRCR